MPVKDAAAAILYPGCCCCCPLKMLLLLSSKNRPQRLLQPHKDHRDLSIILPLSLVRRLVGKLNHPGLGAELKELDPPKGLSEQVRKLVLSVDVARLDAPFLQTASDEVVPHPDVLTPFM